MSDEEMERERVAAATELIIARAYIIFLKNKRSEPKTIRVSQDVLDAICPVEKQREYTGFTYFNARVFVDSEMEPKSAEAIWLQ